MWGELKARREKRERIEGKKHPPAREPVFPHSLSASASLLCCRIDRRSLARRDRQTERHTANGCCEERTEARVMSEREREQVSREQEVEPEIPGITVTDEWGRERGRELLLPLRLCV